MTAIEDKARTLTELADRVEALSGPCRETDAAIGLACGIVRERHGDSFYGHAYYSVLVLERGYYDHEGNAPELPHYTASMDAAMTLVPEGWVKTVADWWCEGEDRPPFFAECADRALLVAGEDAPVFTAWAATPALALTAASLRAIASQVEGLK